MSKEQKDLLIKDLCCRLPYGVKLQHVKNADSIVELYSMDLDDFYCKIKFYTYKGKSLIVSDEGKLLKPGGTLRYKPYLIPLSSMTEGQKDEIRNRFCYEWETDEDVRDLWEHELEFGYALEFIQWCYENHLDIGGLIPKGLTVDCTCLNIY